MGNLFYLLGAILAMAITCTVLYIRNHKPGSVDSGIDSFQRELRALSPDRRTTERALSPDRHPGERDGGSSG